MTTFHMGDLTLAVVRQAVIEYITARDRAAFDREPDATLYVSQRYAKHPEGPDRLGETFRERQLTRVNRNLSLAVDFVKEIDSA